MGASRQDDDPSAATAQPDDATAQQYNATAQQDNSTAQQDNATAQQDAATAQRDNATAQGKVTARQDTYEDKTDNEIVEEMRALMGEALTRAGIGRAGLRHLCNGI